MEERIQKLEAQTEWLMKLHKTAFIVIGVGLAIYLISRK